MEWKELRWQTGWPTVSLSLPWGLALGFWNHEREPGPHLHVPVSPALQLCESFFKDNILQFLFLISPNLSHLPQTTSQSLQLSGPYIIPSVKRRGWEDYLYKVPAAQSGIFKVTSQDQGTMGGTGRTPLVYRLHFLLPWIWPLRISRWGDTLY